MTGLVLWRTGLLLAAVGGSYRWALWVLSFWVLPTQVVVALGLLGGGFTLVIVSLIIEVTRDNKQSNLREEP
ncbi:MAG: hypothetical protein DHS20C11_35780 [Lysobacteraceae bacterium]|nr:MAG: hypothetical protein DHS20C11_35780 [Xanthomonadaceae bacterium]